jgi:hypothetical protein
MNPLGTIRFTLVSPHPPEACATRLSALTASRTSLLGLKAWLSDKPLLGEVSESEIRVEKHDHYRNAMKPVFTAILEPYGAGTRLDCRIGLGMPSLVLVPLMVVAFLFVGTVSVLLLLSNLSDGKFDLDKAWGAMIGLVAPVAFIALSRYLARGQTDFLCESVRSTLDAQEA